MPQPCKPFQTDTIGHTSGSAMQATPNMDTLDQYVIYVAQQYKPFQIQIPQVRCVAQQGKPATSDTDTISQHVTHVAQPSKPHQNTDTIGLMCGSAMQATLDTATIGQHVVQVAYP